MCQEQDEERIRIPLVPERIAVDGVYRDLYTFTDEALHAVADAWRVNLLRRAEIQRIEAKGFQVGDCCANKKPQR